MIPRVRHERLFERDRPHDAVSANRPKRRETHLLNLEQRRPRIFVVFRGKLDRDGDLGAPLENPAHPAKHLKLVALGIDLHEVDRVRVQSIEPHSINDLRRTI